MANEVQLKTGDLSYGNFNFPIAIKARISSKAEDDSTKRFTKYVKYRLEIETVLYPGVDEFINAPNPFFPSTAVSADGLTNIDAMDAVRKILTTRGLPLIFRDKGFGLFEINTLENLDVLNGPNPEVLLWEPIGDNFAVRVVWSVEVTIAECDNQNVNRAGRITESNYSMSWELDIAGLTTRTIQGHLEIVLSISGRTVFNNADLKRELINFPIPLGFGRVSQTYQLNARRDRLDFSIIDREYAADDKNPLHKGIVEMNVQQTTSSVGSVMSTQWMTTISGRILVAKGQPKFLAWIAFLHVVNSRIQRAKQESGVHIKPDSPGISGKEEDTKTPNKKKDIVLPRRLSITEDIYGRGMNFSFSWIMYSTLNTFLNAAGFWQPIPGATAATQITSLTAPNEAWTQRGHKQLRKFAGETLVGLCGPQSEIFTDDRSRRETDVPDYSIFEVTCPQAENSYLDFSPHAMLVEDTRRYVSYPANGGRRPTDNKFRESTVGQNLTGLGTSQTGQFSQLGITHQVGGQTHKVWFFGSATRLGFPIPSVSLLKYGGANCRPVSEFNRQTALAPVDIGGCLLYRATWRKLYTIETQPSGEAITTDPSAESINITTLSIPIR